VFCQGPQKKKQKSVDDTEEVSTHPLFRMVLSKIQSILIILFKVSPGNNVSAKKVRSAEQSILLILTIFCWPCPSDYKECGRHCRGEHPSVISYCIIKDSKYPHNIFQGLTGERGFCQKGKISRTVDTPDIDNLLLTMSFSLKIVEYTEEVSTHLFILYCIIKDQSILIRDQLNSLIVLILTIFADYVILTMCTSK